MQRICTRSGDTLELSFVRDGTCMMMGRSEDFCSRNGWLMAGLTWGGRPSLVLVLKVASGGGPMAYSRRVGVENSNLGEGQRKASPMDEILVGSLGLRVVHHHLGDRRLG